MHNEKMPIAEYEKLPPRFNPTGFDPAAWVAAADAEEVDLFYETVGDFIDIMDGLASGGLFGARSS